MEDNSTNKIKEGNYGGTTTFDTGSEWGKTEYKNGVDRDDQSKSNPHNSNTRYNYYNH